MKYMYVFVNVFFGWWHPRSVFNTMYGKTFDIHVSFARVSSLTVNHANVAHKYCDTKSTSLLPLSLNDLAATAN